MPNTIVPPNDIFKGLTFFLASCLSLTDRANARKSLIDNGAIERGRIEEAEYIFTDTDTLEGSKNARAGAIVIKPEWVKMSLMNKARQPPRSFSASPLDFFSTLVFTCDHLSKGDVDAFMASTISRGGSYREMLTKDTTHLLVLSPTGDQYKTARRYQAATGVKIVLMHWFDDCFKVEQRLPESPYEKPLLDAEKQYLDPDGNWIGTTGQAPRGSTSGNSRPAIPEKAGSIHKPLVQSKTSSISASFPIFLEPSPYDRPLSPTKRPISPNEMSRFGFVDQHLSPYKDNSKRDHLQAKGASGGDATPRRQNVWKGRHILLSHSLILSKERRRTIEREVETAGGIIVPNRAILRYCDPAGTAYSVDEVPHDSEEYKKREKQEACVLATANPPVDVYITQYRSGLAYLTAILQVSKRPKQVQVDDSEEGQTLPDTSGQPEFVDDMSIGSLWWLFYTHMTTIITPPTAHLLYYPVRKGAVSGLEGKEITISNYTGPARDYLKKLIAAVGAEFTATMSQKTSVVIAANLGGPKAERAQSWKIPIVNHIWLEETFVNWKVKNLLDPKYGRFTIHAPDNQVLNDRSVGTDEDGSMNYEMEISMVLKDLKRIGYESEWVEVAKSGRLEQLLRESGEEGIDGDAVAQEQSDDEGYDTESDSQEY